jgi:hypothetical protein
MKSMRVSLSLLATVALTFSLAVCAQAQKLSEHNPSSLRQLAQLTAPDGGNGTFGYSIAMSGDTIVVGAPLGHNSTGAAYVYVKPVTGWADMIETAELTASDGNPGLNFGFSVAISGDTIVVGSYGHNAVYLFTKPHGGWTNMTETAVLSTDNGIATLFGEYVAIDGSTIAVSEPKTFTNRGRVQVFTEPAGGWVNATPTGRINASDTTDNSYFGVGLSVSGSTIVVGAFGNNDGTGAAYVFVQPKSGWSGSHSQTAKLSASDGKAQDVFGAFVAINGSTIVVGADGKKNQRGGAYLFVAPPTGWKDMTETGKLAASDLVQFDYFGNAVAVSPTRIAVGSSLNGGTAYTYVEPSTGWKSLLATSEVTVPGAQNYSSVAIGDTILAAGAPSNSVAYVFGP